MPSDSLNLPDPRNIRKFFSGINHSTEDSSQNIQYINFKISTLKPVQNLFVLMIDEIHIKPKAEYHLNYGFHGVDKKIRIWQKLYSVL